MPRGLGEDPLTRQRKSGKRSAAQSASAVVADSGAPREQMVDATSSRPASYNDVFFRNRSEGAAAASGSGAGLIQDGQTMSPSAVAQQPVSEVEASRSPEGAPAESPTTAFAAPPAEVPTSEIPSVQQDAPAAFLVASPPDAAPSPPPAPENADSANRGPQQGGLFKRLFGKFRK